MAFLQTGNTFVTFATTSTLKTAAGMKSPANQAIKALGIHIGCDGTNSAQGPAIVKVGTCTFAGAGTAGSSTAAVPRDSGRPETIQGAATQAYTVEPTVIVVVEAFYVPVYMGSAIVYYPLTAPLIGKGGNGWSMSVTQQSGVTANATGDQVSEE